MRHLDVRGVARQAAAPGVDLRIDDLHLAPSAVVLGCGKPLTNANFTPSRRRPGPIHPRLDVRRPPSPGEATRISPLAALRWAPTFVGVELEHGDRRAGCD